MSNKQTIAEMNASDLPPDLLARLGIDESDMVTIFAKKQNKKSRVFDERKFYDAIKKIRSYPDKDKRNANDIIGYDENGLPA